MITAWKPLKKQVFRNQSVSQYHKLEKKLNEDLSRMEELEDQLKSIIVKTCRCRIQEKIRNLRKMIKKEKTELEREMPTRMRLAMRLLQIPTRDRSDRENLEGVCPKSFLWVYPGLLEELV